MISVVIAAYNEEKSIEKTVAEVRRVCTEMAVPFEIIAVDDGSTDATVSLLRELDVRVLSNPHNAGYGFSLKKGISAARYETIVITDADQTYPFSQIPDLYRVFLKGFDMVVGARTGAPYTGSFFKMLLRKILTFIVEFTAERKIPDINSGLRIFKRDRAQEFFSHLCNGFSFTTSLTLAYMMTGKFVSYVPIPYGQRAGKTKVRLLRDSLKTLQYILQAAIYYNPLKIFLLFSGLCLLFAGFWFCVSLVLGLTVGFFLGVGSILVALIVLCLGLLADLLRQILKGRSL
ncbi:MAG: glycosyltransferase family 2 protein [Holosporales bacterium]|jgi:glycosyltransferase involved in cell wall biosynthesis|nr:glycosyltransferase family 2 protein [Holosporales bacterium]